VTLLLAACPALPAARPAPVAQESPAELARNAAAAISRESTHLEREKALSILIALCKADPDGTPLDKTFSDEIEAMARSEEVFRRLAAVRTLASLCRPDMAERLLSFLEDPSHAVRTAALNGLRNSLGARSWQVGFVPFSPLRGVGIEDILPLLDDPFWPVRRAALFALAATGDPGAAGPMLRALADAEPEVRRAALHFLGELTGEIPGDDLNAAAKGLNGAELLQFLKSALPLARPGNASFFREKFEKLGASAAGLRALACAVAAGDGLARRNLIVRHLPEIIALSVHRHGETENAADTLLGWAAEHHDVALIAALRKKTFSGDIPPEKGVRLLTAAFGIGAVPALEEWAVEAIGTPGTDGSHGNRSAIANRDDLVAACVADLNFGLSPRGASALARLIPLLEGDLLKRAVTTAACLVEHRPQGDLLAALIGCALEAPPDTASRAFGALCRLDDPTAQVVAILLDRFRKESGVEDRKTFALQLAEAARGGNREAVTLALIEEVEQRLPAALTAGACLYRIADKASIPRCAAALASLLHSSSVAEERENILVALVRLEAPGTEKLIVRETETLLHEGNPAGIARIVTSLGRFEGKGIAALLGRLARHENRAIGTRAIRALMIQRNPLGIEILEEIFPGLGSGTRLSLLAGIAESGQSIAAAAFLERTIAVEKDTDVLRDAIEALAPATAASVAPRLLEIASSPVRFGPEASEAAIYGLAKSGDPKALYLMKGRLKSFLKEARTAQEVFFDMEDPHTLAALATVRALALCGDPEAPALLTGLLFQYRRAQRGNDILSSWSNEAEGVETIEDHDWIGHVLAGLLTLPDEMIEKALSLEMDRLKKTGDLYLIGDASFCLLFRELLSRKRCPRLRERLERLVFQCRPDHSPAEFRLCVMKGDEQAAAGRPGSAARYYMRARFIARYRPPSRRVVRQLLQDSVPIEGHDPLTALHSEALSLLAVEMERLGRPGEAAELARMAERISPFLRHLPDLPPSRTGGTEGERAGKTGGE
jgi:HEAT repeat protein